MKLHLSSYRIPNITAFKELVGTELSEISVAYIPNAGDYYAPRAKQFKINASISDLQSFGLQDIEVVDLQDYRDKDVLRKKLQNFQLIWVAGGNTFCLREEMRKSGFELIIADLLRSGIIYAGESAGAIVAGTSLKGVEFCDNPEFAEQVIWNGLGVVPDYLLPHAGSEAFGEAIEKAKALYDGSSDVIELTDQQALIITNDTKVIVTGSDNVGIND